MIGKDELAENKRRIVEALSMEWNLYTDPAFILKLHELIERQSEMVKVLEEALKTYANQWHNFEGVECITAELLHDGGKRAAEALQKLAELRGGK